MVPREAEVKSLIVSVPTFSGREAASDPNTPPRLLIDLFRYFPEEVFSNPAWVLAKWAHPDLEGAGEELSGEGFPKQGFAEPRGRDTEVWSDWFQVMKARGWKVSALVNGWVSGPRLESDKVDLAMKTGNEAAVAVGCLRASSSLRISGPARRERMRWAAARAQEAARAAGRRDLEAKADKMAAIYSAPAGEYDWVTNS